MVNLSIIDFSLFELLWVIFNITVAVIIIYFLSKYINKKISKK